MKLETTLGPRNVLLISTRPLGAPWTGRKIVLRTAVESLTRLGHRVVVAAFGDDDTEGAALAAGAVAVRQLPSPSPLRLLAGAVGPRRSWTLNEQLWWHPAALAELRTLVVEHQIDLVVADGLRTTRYAEALGLPWFVDLDDLLSDRYSRWSSGGLRMGQVAGFRRPQHRLQQLVADRIPAALVLRYEAKRLRAREIEIARAANGVSLVSPVEAGHLAERCGRPVSNLPMAIQVSGHRDWTGPTDLRSMAFTGSLTWWPNLAAVRWWAHELEPELHRRGLTGYKLHVFGDVPRELLPELDVRGVVLEGRRTQADLQRELASYSVLLVPQDEAMGLTTKIIEAALIGMVVVTTRAGTDGMDVTDRREVVHFDDVDELEQQLRWLAEQPTEELARIGAHGQVWAQRTFGPEAVTDRWRKALQDVPALPESSQRHTQTLTCELRELEHEASEGGAP